MHTAWTMLLREYPAQITDTLKVYFEPEAAARNLEAASLFALTTGLLRHADLAEHFDDVAQAFLQTIFYKREAKLSPPSLRRVGYSLMLMMFRYMTDSKPVATRYLGSLLLEVASQLDAEGSPEDADFLYAISVKATTMCMDNKATAIWLERATQYCFGRNLLSTIERHFFSIYNHFLFAQVPDTPEILHGLLMKVEAAEQIIRAAEDEPRRDLSDDALKYYRCWFIMIKAEVYLRLGRENLVPTILHAAGTIILQLPTSLRVALVGLTRFAGKAATANGSGIHIAEVLAMKLQRLVSEPRMLLERPNEDLGLLGLLLPAERAEMLARQSEGYPTPDSVRSPSSVTSPGLSTEAVNSFDSACDSMFPEQDAVMFDEYG